MFCKNCGNEIKDNAKFCSKCGTPTISDNSEQQNIEQEVFLACKYIHQIPQALCIVWLTINMNMDSAIVIATGHAARFSD